MEMMTRKKIIDYIVDMFIINLTGLVIVVPFYAWNGMDRVNLWRVFVSFWTINWFVSFAIVWTLKRFRKRFPYMNKES